MFQHKIGIKLKSKHKSCHNKLKYNYDDVNQMNIQHEKIIIIILLHTSNKTYNYKELSLY